MMKDRQFPTCTHFWPLKSRRDINTDDKNKMTGDCAMAKEKVWKQIGLPVDLTVKP